ncbi:MAG: hypothetical protein F6K10_16805, partial [Moorea sp. SIO2B7]|nr:hypothetical protein [Moorena sp. SIO2B7]
MSATVKTLVNQPYKYGFVTNIEADSLLRGHGSLLHRSKPWQAGAVPAEGGGGPPRGDLVGNRSELGREAAPGHQPGKIP